MKSVVLLIDTDNRLIWIPADRISYWQIDPTDQNEGGSLVHLSSGQTIAVQDDPETVEAQFEALDSAELDHAPAGAVLH